MGAAGSSAPSDDQFNRVSFLSHFEGSNNGVNNAFDDGSTSNHTITANGNVTQGSFGPFARPDGNWGWNFDGDGDYLTVADSTEFDFGTGNFTIEGWINPAVISGFQAIFSIGSPVQIYSYNNTIISYFNDEDNGSTYTINGLTGPSSSVSANTWTHFAVVRNGNTYTTYVNGVAGSSLTSSDTVASSSNAPAIGTYLPAPTTYEFNGHISNLRLVKGTAVYTSNFTPSTSKLTAITNTKLLTCQSNRFIDNSASGHAITTTGTPAVTAFGPFLTDAVYKAGTNGASVYMDGDGDYLQAANSADFDLGTGNFTWECYANIDDITRTQWFFSVFTTSSGQNAWGLRLESNGTLNAYFSGDGGESPTTIGVAAASSGLTENAWHHIAVVKNGTGSNNIQVYVDGVSKVTGTFGAIHDTNLPFRVGRQGNDSYAQYFLGYISDVRIVKGTAVYTGNFTPPSAPLTAITNTKMLLNMADAQAIDSAAQNNLTLYGTAKTSTAQYKFGTASLLLDGNSDYVSFADADSGSMFNFGATKWTIEGWFYQENDAGSSSSSHSIISRWDNQNSDKGFIFRITDSSGQKLQWLHTTDGSTNVIYTDSRTISNDTWYHFALVKNDNLTLYLNGTGAVLNSSTFTIASTTIQTLIGSVHESGSPSQYFDGYIDDLRVSHMARYTSNFTAPTKAFADKGQ